MAPSKRGVKREAQAVVEAEAAAAAAPAKKQRLAPELMAVAEIIEQAEELPEACRRMLTAGLPRGLGASEEPKGHEMQIGFITMIEEVMTSAQARLQARLDEENSQLDAARARAAALNEAQLAAETALTEAVAVTEGRIADVLAASEAVAAAAATVEECLSEQAAGDADMVNAQERLAAVQRALETDVAAILAGETDDCTNHCEALLPTLRSLGNVDQSLISALPSVCSKPKTARGAFDGMVLEQLGATLRQHAAALAAAVEAAQPEAQGRAAAVAAARAAQEQAEDARRTADEVRAKAQQAMTAACDAATSAKDAAATFDSEFIAATEALDVQVTKVQAFKSHNMASFVSLREKAGTTQAVTAGGA